MNTNTNKADVRAVSHDLAAIRADRSVNGAADVTYSVVPNAMPASQEAAPYLGRTRVAGSCSQDELAEDMVKAGCQMDVEEIKRVWNGFGAYLLDRMPLAPRAFDLGFVRVWPVIGGTFPSVDAEFDPERNELYVAASPSAAIRDALAGCTPTSAGAAPESSMIGNVQEEGGDEADTIRNGARFEILGRNLTIGSGDERAELKLPGDGGAVPVTLEAQTATDGSQRIFGSLAQSVPACEGAVLTLWTHGQRTEGDPYPVSSGKLTVLAATPPTPTGDEPEIERGYSEGEGHPDGQVFPYYAFILQGVNLDGATVKIGYTEEGAYREVDVPDEKLTVTDTTITIASDSVELEDAIAAGGTVTFKATTEHGTATYEAEVQE